EVGKHGVEHRLPDLRAGLALALEAVEQQDAVQDDHLEPAVDSVGYAEVVIQFAASRLRHNRVVEAIGGPGATAAEDPADERAHAGDASGQPADGAAAATSRG